MIKEYVFRVTERSIGFVVVRSDHFPSDSEVMDEIYKGNACYENTDYEKLVYVSEKETE